MVKEGLKDRMNERRMNRKGQEGVTLTTLLLIILGIVIVVVIILGATGAFNFIFGKVNILPGQDLQAVVESCKIAASQGLIADYCLEFKKVEIDGVTEYLNCQDSRVQNSFGTDVEDKVKSCHTTKSNEVDVNATTKKCVDLIETRGYDGKDKVNGVPVTKNDTRSAKDHCTIDLKL